MTFAKLDEAVRKWVRYLQSQKIGKGMYIGVCMPNSVCLIQVIFALQYVGAVTVFLNTRLTAQEKQVQLADVNAEILLIAHESYGVEGTKVRNLLLSEGDVALLSPVMVSETIQACQEDDVATIMFTSGTTGKAKGVMETYGNHFYSAMHAALHMGLEAKDKWLVQLPIFHVSGYSTLIKSMVYGMPIVLPEHKGIDCILETIQKQEVTLISMVAKNLQDIFSIGKAACLKPLRGILLGGSAVNESLLKQCQQFDLPIHLSYGMTETASQVATLGGEDVYRKIGSVGKPLFLNQIQIHQADALDGVGEIWVKGPTVMKGYYGLPEEMDKRMTEDGYFRTGDLGSFDAEGFLYIADRRSDLIISGGENIYPAELEAKMMEMHSFLEVAVVGKKHITWGEVPVAFYVVQEGKHISPEEIRAFLQTCLAKYKIPHAFYEIKRLPRNALGKVQKNKLKQQIKEA